MRRSIASVGAPDRAGKTVLAVALALSVAACSAELAYESEQRRFAAGQDYIESQVCRTVVRHRLNERGERISQRTHTCRDEPAGFVGEEPWPGDRGSEEPPDLAP